MARGSTNKHQQKTEETERKLLKAAQRVFVRDGFEAARIEDIAREAGYTRGAFYAHFQAKEDLFFAMLEQQSQAHFERLRGMLENCGDEAERLRTLRDYYAARAGDRQWSVLVLEFKLYALRHKRLRARLAEAYRNIRLKMRLEGMAKIMPPEMQSDLESRDWRKVTLEILLHGFLLEQAYDPAFLPEDKIQLILGRMFDFVVASREL